MGQSQSASTLNSIADIAEQELPLSQPITEPMASSTSSGSISPSGAGLTDFEFDAPRAPLDSDGFVRAFYPPPPLDGLPDSDDNKPPQYDSVQEIQDFFDEYGFVVIRDAVPAALIAQLKSEIWSKPGLSGCDAGDANSWMHADWNTVFCGSYNEKRGFLGFELAESQAAHDVRQMPALHRSFAAIYRQTDLWFKYDRFGFMRPTRDIRVTKRTLRIIEARAARAAKRMYDEAPIGAAAAATAAATSADIISQLEPQPDDDDVVSIDRPEWRTNSDFVHWDLNPWLEQHFCRVQGVLAISEHTATSGGFHCIPGFQHQLARWAECNKAANNRKCLVDLKTPSQMRNLQHITMRPGSIVIWDSRLPHGNWPNDDGSFRLVMYHTCFPALSADANVLHTRKLTNSAMRAVQSTDLGRWLLGEEQYPEHLRQPSEHVNLSSLHNLGQWGVN